MSQFQRPRHRPKVNVTIPVGHNTITVDHITVSEVISPSQLASSPYRLVRSPSQWPCHRPRDHVNVTVPVGHITITVGQVTILFRHFTVPVCHVNIEVGHATVTVAMSQFQFVTSSTQTLGVTVETFQKAYTCT